MKWIAGGVILVVLAGSPPMAAAIGWEPIGSGSNDGFSVSDIESNRAGQASSDPGARPKVISTDIVDCGRPTLVKRAIASSPRCATVWLQCNVESESLLLARRVTDLLVIRTYDDGRTLEQVACNVPTRHLPPPRLTAAMVRDRAQRLLPHPQIGSAPPGHATLVNIETVLWVDTAPQRRLGTATLLGRRVDIRAHIERVAWDFDDDATATTTGPGTPYTNAHPCRTKQCPGYFGHTYADTGTMTITADLTWTGQFRVDGGAWQTIPGTVTAAATSTTIDVKEARGVLVPNS